MIKKAQHPSGDIITFNDYRHTYKSLRYPKKWFVSGTGFLKYFFEKFDSEGISKRYAAKHGMSQKDVLALWARKGDIGREMGTLVHQFCEDTLDITKPNPTIEDITHPDPEIVEKAKIKAKVAIEVLKIIQESYEIIAMEEIIASLKYDLAGMIDLRARNKKTGAMALLDWKTNGSIAFEGFAGRRALKPITDLDDCDWIKYCLQLNLYEYICTSEGYFDIEKDSNGLEPEKKILHIMEDDFDILPCPNLQPEIKMMISDFQILREEEKQENFKKAGFKKAV